jgi:perosamine synthetase
LILLESNSMQLLKPVDIQPSDMGEDLAAVIPAPEPQLHPVRSSRANTLPNVIRVCEPTLNGNEEKYLLDCVHSNWISSAGPYIRRLETLFAAACGTREAVACASGTVALHLALKAIGIGPGDEVIIPAFTMIATANAVEYTGATAVLADADPITWNIDPSQVAACIRPKTKAMIVVHTYGHPADMKSILQLASEYGLVVIEDAAEAHGAIYEGRRVGSLGHVGTFSLYANKVITTGEGGLLTTDDTDLANLCRTLRDHAFSPERHFWHRYVGFNYRMTNLQAAVGVAQIETFDYFVARRRQNAEWYRARLADVHGLTLPPEEHNVRSVFWMFGMLVDRSFGMSRDELRYYLAQRGIETRTFFVPMHLQPVYFRRYAPARYPVAERLCSTGLYLPSASNLTEEIIDYITDVIKEAHQKGSTKQ